MGRIEKRNFSLEVFQLWNINFLFFTIFNEYLWHFIRALDIMNINEDLNCVYSSQLSLLKRENLKNRLFLFLLILFNNFKNFRLPRTVSISPLFRISTENKEIPLMTGSISTCLDLNGCNVKENVSWTLVFSSVIWNNEKINPNRGRELIWRIDEQLIGRRQGEGGISP